VKIPFGKFSAMLKYSAHERCVLQIGQIVPLGSLWSVMLFEDQSERGYVLESVVVFIF